MGLIDSFTAARQLGLDAMEFFHQAGFTDDDINAFDKFDGALGGHRETLKKNSVNLETIKALIEASDEVRQTALREIDGGIVHSRVTIDVLARNLDNQRRSEGDTLLQRGRVRLHDVICSRLFRTTRALCEAMAHYKSLSIEARQSERALVAEKATIVLEDYERLFGHEYVKLEDWGFVKYGDELNRKFAEAHYALRELAAGRFDGDFPSVDPKTFNGPNPQLERLLQRWSAEEAIMFLNRVSA